jgi:hypothetical protein
LRNAFIPTIIDNQVLFSNKKEEIKNKIKRMKEIKKERKKKEKFLFF